MTNKSYCSNIEDVCINYMINKNFNRNKLTKCVAYIQEKIENNEEKNYILRKNDFVYKNLVKNVKLEEYITDFFVKKLLLICKYKNNPYYNLNIEDLKFIQKFKTKQTEFDDFDYYFFIYILKDFNNFISKKKERIFIEYKHDSFYFGDRLYYNILNKIFLKLNCEKEEYINMSIKKEYLCPISNDLMNEPVKTKYGHIFDKSCIEKWLEIKKSCPLTRKYLKINDCVLQKDLKKEISDWKDKNLSFKYKTNCCKKSYDLESFQEYFLKNCYFKNTNIFNKITNYINGDIDYGFNYNLKCHICNKSIFDNIV